MSWWYRTTQPIPDQLGNPTAQKGLVIRLTAASSGIICHVRVPFCWGPHAGEEDALKRAVVGWQGLHAEARARARKWRLRRAPQVFPPRQRYGAWVVARLRTVEDLVRRKAGAVEQASPRHRSLNEVDSIIATVDAVLVHTVVGHDVRAQGRSARRRRRRRRRRLLHARTNHTALVDVLATIKRCQTKCCRGAEVLNCRLLAPLLLMC